MAIKERVLSLTAGWLERMVRKERVVRLAAGLTRKDG